MEQLRLIKAPVKPKRNIKIVRFGGKEALPKSGDRVKQFKELIEECEDLYPGIDVWLRKKVLPELQTRTWRSAIVLYENKMPAGVAVMRHGKSAKFCNMRIRPEYQGSGLGPILTNIAMLECRAYSAKDVHFTIPAHLWEGSMGSFLKEYKFDFRGMAKVQYRQRGKSNPNPELACGAPFLDIWEVVREKIAEGHENFILEGNFRDIELLVSIKPKYARAIVYGEKTVELRRKFDPKWQGARLAIYASSWKGSMRTVLTPKEHQARRLERSIVGEATVDKVTSDEPHKIWEKYHDKLSCTFEEFSEYSRGKKILYAIQLSDIVRYPSPISKTQLQVHVNEELTAPQSYYCIINKKKWQDALKWGSLVRANR